MRSSRKNDAMGRVTQYTEYNASHVATKSRTSTYDADNRLLSDTTDVISGSTTNRSVQDYEYKLGTASGYNGADQGVVTHIHEARYTNGTLTTALDTGYFYTWWDEAKQDTIKVNATDRTSRASGNWAPGQSKLEYDVNGHIVKLTDYGSDGLVNTGDDRVTTYQNDAYGQVLVGLR